MSKNTTTKVTLPTSKDLSALEAFRGSVAFAPFTFLAHSMKAVLTKENGLTARDRKTVWEQAEERFLGERGISWRELLAELQNETAREQEEAAASQPQQAQGQPTEGAQFGYPRCLAPLSQKGREAMEAEYNALPDFRPVSAQTYGSLFKGAASSRRFGIRASEWIKRTQQHGYSRRLLLLVAFRAYSAPTAQICGAR